LAGAHVHVCRRHGRRDRPRAAEPGVAGRGGQHRRGGARDDPRARGADPAAARNRRSAARALPAVRGAAGSLPGRPNADPGCREGQAAARFPRQRSARRGPGGDDRVASRAEGGGRMTRVRIGLALIVLVSTFGLASAHALPFLAAAAPDAPTGVSAIALDGKVKLAWQQAGGADSYDVYRGGALLASAVGTTSFADNAASNGTTYTYAVRSRSTGGVSGDSLSVQATPVARACSTGNAVVLENCFPGSNGWKLAGADAVANGGIAGFATAQSVNKGGPVDLKADGAAGST